LHYWIWSVKFFFKKRQTKISQKKINLKINFKYGNSTVHHQPTKGSTSNKQRMYMASSFVRKSIIVIVIIIITTVATTKQQNKKLLHHIRRAYSTHTHTEIHLQFKNGRKLYSLIPRLLWDAWESPLSPTSQKNC
jgi:hypothetical protein